MKGLHRPFTFRCHKVALARSLARARARAHFDRTESSACSGPLQSSKPLLTALVFRNDDDGCRGISLIRHNPGILARYMRHIVPEQYTLSRTIMTIYRNLCFPSSAVNSDALGICDRKALAITSSDFERSTTTMRDRLLSSLLFPQSIVNYPENSPFQRYSSARIE